MKNIIFKATSLLLVVTSILTSCKKETPTAPSGSTTSGVTAFKGNWYDSENGSISGASTYTLFIEAPDQSTILFVYLYGFHTKIMATVVNNNFTIPAQVIEGNNVSGSGVLTNPSQINMTYVVDNGVAEDNVTVVLTK